MCILQCFLLTKSSLQNEFIQKRIKQFHYMHPCARNYFCNSAYALVTFLFPLVMKQRDVSSGEICSHVITKMRCEEKQIVLNTLQNMRLANFPV